MTSSLLDPAASTQRSHADRASEPLASDRLRNSTIAVRLHIRWPGIRKTLSEPQRCQAADAFDADTKLLSAAKKLLDTSHPAFRAVTAVRTQATQYWREHTLPYVEPGMRLLRHESVVKFEESLQGFKRELTAAVAHLDRSYDELVTQARERLGRLFNSADYPASLSPLFAIEWDYPACSPPEYLRQIDPQLYEQECHRVQTRFEEAVELAETAFANELSELVTHLAERLAGDSDGAPKVFRDSAVTNLLEFFERFQRLNIRSNAELDALVDRARSVVRGVEPQQLRDMHSMRERVSRDLVRVEAALDGWMTNRPRRAILRRSR